MSNIDINSEIRTQQQITDSGNPRKPTGEMTAKKCWNA